MPLDPQVTFNHYLELPESQRFLAQIFALLYEPASKDKVRSCWITAMAQQDSFERMRPPDPKDFKVQVRQLADLDILVPQQGLGMACNENVIDLIARDAVRMATLEPIADAIAQRFPISERFPGGPPFFRNEAQFMREVRIAIYREDLAALKELFKHVKSVYWRSAISIEDAVRTVLTHPFDIDWLDGLSDEFFELGVASILQYSLMNCEPADAVFELLEDYCKNGRVGAKLHLMYAEQLWLRGRFEDARSVLQATKFAPMMERKAEALWGAIAFLTGDISGALTHYKSSIKLAGKNKTAQVLWFQ